jgi:hypothetical protein
MSQDVTECLKVLRQQYSQSPVSSRCNFEMTLDRSGSDESADITRRISIVEESIFEVLHLEHEEGASTSSMMRGILKEIPVASMAHVEALKAHPQPYMYPCKDTYHALPNEPSEWPQRPLMVRPTPYTSTKILGIVSTVYSDQNESIVNPAFACVHTSRGFFTVFVPLLVATIVLRGISAFPRVLCWLHTSHQ